MREKADAAEPSHVAVPFAGALTPLVGEGDLVVAGQPLARVEAMKLEASIPAPRDGSIRRLVISAPAQVDGGDLFAVLD